MSPSFRPRNCPAACRSAWALPAPSPPIPEIIFFDEPTTGLDPIMADIINDLIISTVKDVGATALSITHDMVFGAEDLRPDRHALWRQDHLGRPDREIDHSGNPYVEQFIHGRAEGPIKMAVKA